MNHKNRRYLPLWAVLTLLLLGGSTIGSASQDARGITVFSPYRWHTFYGSDDFHTGMGIAVAEDGSTFIIGNSYDTWLGDNGAEPLHPFSGFVDIFVLKLDSGGAYQWHTFYGADDTTGLGLDWGIDIAIDGDGSVYIVGVSSDSWLGHGGSEPLHPHSGYTDLAVIKLGSNGAYQWHTFYGGSGGSDDARGIAIGEDGSLYVVGESRASWLGDGDTQPMHAYSGGPDIVILKLDRNGAYQWHTFYGSNHWDTGMEIAWYEDGSLFITGASNATWQGDGSVLPLSPYTGEFDFYVLKLDSDGLYQWHTFYGSESYDGGDGVAGIVATENGNVIIAGKSSATWEGDNGEAPLHPYSGSSDITVFSLNDDGAYQWHTFYGSGDYDIGTDIVYTLDSNIYVIGESGEVWLGDDNEEPLHAFSGGNDFMILKLDDAGIYQWHTFYGSDEGDGPLGIAAGEDGSTYISGSSTASWLGDSGSNPLHPYCENCLYNIAILKLWDGFGTNTELISAPNPSTYRQDVTFTATISHTWIITPTGAVTFTEGENLLGIGLLDFAGVATYITSTLEIGDHHITAEYSGDDYHYGSTSETLTHTVNKAETFSSLISTPNPSVYGESVTFSATVTSTIGITPTGIVTFTEGDNLLGTGMLDGSGNATLVTDSLTTGEHLITAEYGGDEVNAGSTSAPLIQVVNKAETMSDLTSSPNPSVYGVSVTFTMSVTSSRGITPSGMVSLMEEEIILGTGVLDGSGIETMIVPLLEVGDHAIYAAYPGDANFLPGSSAVLVQVVEAWAIEERVYLPVIQR